MFYIAGLGRFQESKHRAECYVNMVTTEACLVIEPIHVTPREVVCLRNWDEVETWLSPDPGECKELIKPATPEILETHHVHPDVLTKDYPIGNWPEPWNPPKQAGLDAF